MNPPLHPSQEGNLKPVLPTKLPVSEGNPPIPAPQPGAEPTPEATSETLFFGGPGGGFVIPLLAPREGAQPMNKIHRIRLNSTSDIVSARLQARDLAIQLGFCGLDVTLIAAAISTVARFVVQQNRGGEIVLEEVTQGERSGLRITALAEAAPIPGEQPGAAAVAPPDHSEPKSDPDVANLHALMHEMKVVSSTSGDTTIIMKRWK